LETQFHIGLEVTKALLYSMYAGVFILKPKLMVSAATTTSPASAAEPQSFRENLRKLESRQWWLWSSTVLVLILLTLAVASFAFPALLNKDDSGYSFYMNQSVRALVGIVLVFSVYLVYQQFLIMRMRNQIADQISSLAKVENLTNEVYKLAVLDPLTGLYNRRSGEQRLAEEISRAARHGRPLTLLLLDLDRLKQINDQFGHAAGDTALRASAERLQRAIRGSDQAVRLGGDEFMVILPECKADEVRHVLGRLEDLMVEHEGQKIPCRFSRGWTDYRAGETAQELINRADAALYEDKRNSNSKIRLQSSSGNPNADAQLKSPVKTPANAQAVH
jgi:diguanylate cyclase (GGDEF)-like protein